MSTEDVTLHDLKCCVLCGTQLSGNGSTSRCENKSCAFQVTARGCESQMSAYAQSGSMKYCYACGKELESDDNILACPFCSDSVTFDVTPSEDEIIEASEVKNCPFCGSPMETKPSGKMYCSKSRCKFRIMDIESQQVTKALQGYSDKGKVKFCYACGSSTSDDGEYTSCTNEDCSSLRLPARSREEKAVMSNRRTATAPEDKLLPSTTPGAFPEKNNVKPNATTSGSSNDKCLPQMNKTQVSTSLREPGNTVKNDQRNTKKNKKAKKARKSKVQPIIKNETESSEPPLLKPPEVENVACANENGDKSEEDTSVIGYFKKSWKSLIETVKNTLTAKKARPVFQMVLIGETGSGKTSLFNLLCNFDLVCQLGLENSLEILRNFHDLDLENAQQRAMESKTSDAKYYKVKFGELEVGIIDTPGFGDSRGIDEDRKNVKKIIDTIERAEYVNCICLVINGRQARATFQLKYVLTEISATLPKSAFNNLIIIMTNSQDVTCATFDVSELSSFFGSEVIIKPEHVFYIDNPYSKLEKCRKEKKAATLQQLVSALQISFQTAGLTLMQMLDTIKDFNDVHTNCFVQLYNIKQEVEKNTLHLLVADQNRKMLEKEIARQKELLDAAMSTKTLNKEFTSTFKVKKVVVVATKEHNTICGAPNCNSNCHVPCHLSKTLDKENLKGCGCIDRSTGNFTCKICGHSYRDHFHSESVFEIQEEENVFTDEERRKKFEDARSQEELCVRLNAEYDAELKRSLIEMEDRQKFLIATLETFQSLGSSPSYEKVLECQIYVLEQRIKAQEAGDDMHTLCSTKEDLEHKLSIVKEVQRDMDSKNRVEKIKWARSILQVGSSATKEEIEKAYKTLAKTMHPDKTSGSDAKFQSLQKAYEILTI